MSAVEKMPATTEPARYVPPQPIQVANLAALSESASVVAMIERAARDPNVDIDKFERLMAMKERIDAQAAKRSFNAAVSAAKGEIGPIVKNREVDFSSQKGRTHYRHEDFAEIVRVVDPVLGQHGLSYRFRSEQEGNKLKVTCILSHRDGYVEETTLSTLEDHSGNKNPIQAIGSAATYLQRYTLKLALGLASSADDDGRSAGGATQPPQDDDAPTLSAEQLAKIEEALSFRGINKEKFVRYVLKVSALANVYAREFDGIMKKIENSGIRK